MSRNLSEPSAARDVAYNRFGVRDVRRKPYALHWMVPDCDFTDPDSAEEGCTGLEPNLQNSYAQPDPDTGLEFFAFRNHADGSLEFRGHLDVEDATSGTVAFTLPGVNDGDPLFVLPKSQYWHTVVTDDGGTNFIIALVFIDSTTGDVTLTWPAT